MSKTSPWGYCNRTKVLLHITEFSIHIANNRGNEITEMTLNIPKEMGGLESIRLIHASTEYFRKILLYNPPSLRLKSGLQLKRV